MYEYPSPSLCSSSKDAQSTVLWLVTYAHDDRMCAWYGCHSKRVYMDALHVLLWSARLAHQPHTSISGLSPQNGTGSAGNASSVLNGIPGALHRTRRVPNSFQRCYSKAPQELPLPCFPCRQFPRRCSGRWGTELGPRGIILCSEFRGPMRPWHPIPSHPIS